MMVDSALLADVKNYLNITWDDEATDNKISSLIALGQVYLNDKGGAELDYLAAGYPRLLLFDFVRYARDEALDVFENNYRSYILAMQNQRQVADYVQSTEQT